MLVSLEFLQFWIIVLRQRIIDRLSRCTFRMFLINRCIYEGITPEINEITQSHSDS